MFMFEWQNGSKEVIFDATCIICMDSTSASEFLWSDVGERILKGIFIENEAGIEMEART